MSRVELVRTMPWLEKGGMKFNICRLLFLQVITGYLEQKTNVRFLIKIQKTISGH